MDWRAAQIGREIAQNAPPRNVGTTGFPASREPPCRALERRETVEPGPFPPQRLGLSPPQAPKRPVAVRGFVAATGAHPAAPLVGAEPERAQQIGLRAAHQRHALPKR